MKAAAIVKCITAICVAGFLLVGSGPAFAQRRTALVIGNSNYPQPLTLRNPNNDADLIASTLERELGFVVLRKSNLTRGQLYDAKKELLDAARGVDTVIVYYSGHGVQGLGGDYLVPTDARIRTQDDIKRDAVPVSEVIDALKATGARVAILIVDACRDFSYGKGAPKGLSLHDGAENVLIAYATEQGQTAEEGQGRYSPYAKALAQYLKRTDISLLHALDLVKDAVVAETGNAQTPTRSGTLRWDTCLFANRCRLYTPNEAAPEETRSVRDDEDRWRQLSARGEPSEYLAYQLAFPKGNHVEEARTRAGNALRTRSGCALREYAMPTQEVEVEWQGRCVEGLADGPGTKTYLRDGVATTVWKSNFLRGIPIGTWVGSFPTATGPNDRREVTFTYDAKGEVSRVQKVVLNSGLTYVGETTATTANPLSAKPHGRGVWNYPDGGSYEGEIVQGYYEGEGTRVYPPSPTTNASSKYIGGFKKGVFSGNGTMWFADGGIYTGNWLNGLREGHGKQTGPMGEVTDGEWTGGKLIRAVVTYPRSDKPGANIRYEGSFRDNVFSGQGTLQFAGGSYSGNWAGGKPHGRGKEVRDSGEEYDGDWSSGRKVGRGEMKFARSSNPGALARYTGEFKDGMPNGQGTIYWANGARYTGAVVDTRPHGWGELQRTDGRVVRCMFDKSRPINDDVCR